MVHRDLPAAHLPDRLKAASPHVRRRQRQGQDGSSRCFRSARPRPSLMACAALARYLSASAATANENDPALRHRLARSRREAGPSPLLSALAAMEGYRAEPAVAAGSGEPDPAAEPRKSRWSFRDLLLERRSAEDRAARGEGAEHSPIADRLSATRRGSRRRSDPAQPERVEPAPVVDDEPRQAGDRRARDRRARGRRTQFPVRRDDPRWRPLIDPVSVIGGIGRSKKLIAADDVDRRDDRRRHRAVDAEEIRSLCRAADRSARPQAHRPRPHADRPAQRRHAGDRREPGSHADVGHRAQPGSRQVQPHRG